MPKDLKIRINPSEQYVLAELPGLLSFLPLLYVAWADEIITPSERRMIQEKADAQPWLSAVEKQLLRQWTDPQHPPKPGQLKSWLRIIRNAAGELPESARTSLAEMGMRLADVGTEHRPETYKSAEATAALGEIEAALGIMGKEAMREIMAPSKRPEADPSPEVEADCDVCDLRDLLEGEHADLRRKVKMLLSDPVFSLETIPTKEAYREQVLEWCQLMANQGWGALSYPEFSGGKNDMASYIAVFETMGYHDLSLLIKFGVQFGLFGGSILNLGTETHHRKYLGDAGTLALPGCFAMTEANHGSNVRDIETTAIYDPATQEFVIHTPIYSAHKEYIGNAATHGQMATVFAQLETLGESYGVHAFVVPIRDKASNVLPGVRIEDSGYKLGLNGVDNGRIWFNQVRIPRENLLDRFASVSEAGEYDSPITSESKRFFTMLGTLVGGRVCVPMAGLSAAKKGLSIAIQYADQRRQFGPSDAPETQILDYPTHQRRLMPLLANAYAFHFAHREMADQYVNLKEEDVREFEALAAGLKSVSTWNTTRTLQECREACGGNGYLAVNQFASLKADTEIFTTFEGDNTVLMQLVAKGRLSEFRQAFSSMNFFGMVRFFGQQATTLITEMNPITTRNRDEGHLRDSEFHLAAFRYREEHMVMGAAKRLQKRIKGGMDPYDAFIEVQTHLVNMAHAYMDRVVLEYFQQAIEAAPANTQPVLRRLCQLYALHQIEANKGWYLEYGYIEAPKSKAISRLVDTLCAEVRKDALLLVEAFDIPEGCLRAEIVG